MPPPPASSRVRPSHGRRSWSLLLLLTWTPGLSAQETTHIIRGRVTDTTGAPLVDAIVSVRGTSGATRVVDTDRQGRYTVLFTPGDQAYALLVRHVGFAPHTEQVYTNAATRVLVRDVVLIPAPYQLAPITATASRPTAPIDLVRAPTGTVDRDALQRRRFAPDPGSLTGLALLLPGVRPTDSGYTVLGLDPSLNRVQLDGRTFEGDGLPPDAIGSARLATSTFDPSRGEFSGALLTIRSQAGSPTRQGVVRGRVTPGFLTWADRARPIPVRANLSGFMGGPLPDAKGYYRFAWDLDRQWGANGRSLLADAATATDYGVAADSVAEIRRVIAATGIPLEAPASGATTLRSSLRLDLPFGGTSTLMAMATASFGTTTAPGTLTSLPSTGRVSRQRLVTLNTAWSSYLGGMMASAGVGIQHRTTDARAHLALPSGLVDVGTVHAGTPSGLVSVAFGGVGGAGETAMTRADLNAGLTWNDLRGRHVVKWGGSLSSQQMLDRRDPDPFGTVRYRSLDALATGQADEYLRIISPSRTTGATTIGSLWIGDAWTPGKQWSIEGGLRMDASRTGTRIAQAPIIEKLFGLRTDHTPREISWSPRLGATWHSKPRTVTGPVVDSSLANPADTSLRARMMRAPEVRVSSLIQALADVNRRPWITLGGGFGAYRGPFLSSTQVASLHGATGTGHSSLTLHCAPPTIPDIGWAPGTAVGYRECADGSLAASPASVAPAVLVYDPAFRAPASWRANMMIGGMSLGSSLVLGVDLTLSRTRRVGWTDENIRRSPGMILADELGRPSAARPSEISPVTGRPLAAAGREVPTFATVRRMRSDLESSAIDLTAVLMPRGVLQERYDLLTWVVIGSRGQRQRGFNGTTDGDPFALTSAPRTMTGEIGVTGRLVLMRGVQLIALLRAQSGVRYTPVVAGDINGDGLAWNDRAFVPDPATADPALAGELQSLIQRAPSTAATCLRQQFGRIAGEGSCAAPWNVDMDLHLAFNLSPALAVSRHLTLSAGINGAGDALKRLLGLQDVLGSGGNLPPDPVLVTVTGFDPVNQRYQYQVNPQFGTTRFRPGFGVHPPFSVSLQASWKLAGPPGWQP